MNKQKIVVVNDSMSLPSEQITETLERIMNKESTKDAMQPPTREVKEILERLGFYDFRSHFLPEDRVTFIS